MKSRSTILTHRRIPFAAEYYDRLKYETDQLGGYRLVPNQQLPHITINERGFRGPVFTGQERYLLLGDSVTFGIGAESDNMVFSRFLERAAGAPVADASLRAYRVSQHLSQLPGLIQLVPRIQGVVLWAGFADLLYWVTSGGKTRGAFQFNLKYAARPAWENELRSWLSPNRFKKILGFGKNASAVEPLEKLVEVVSDAVLSIEKFCVERNIRFLFLVQPFVRRSAPKDAELDEILQECDRKTKEKCGVSWYAASEDFVKGLQDRLKGRTRDGLIDCQSFVDDADFLDQVHLRASALEKIAGRITATEAWKKFNVKHS